MWAKKNWPKIAGVVALIVVGLIVSHVACPGAKQPTKEVEPALWMVQE
jgi:hypothetical protein